MIFLSAQPDNFYFIWQIELQLFNLKIKKWSIDDIHILIAYNEKDGISKHSRELKEKFSGYNIFFYTDSREYKKYASTIRPHIIQKHFEKHPYLKEEAIFYIDSDVIFREIPDYSSLIETNQWYASDTRYYMSYQLIINALGRNVFHKMCEIVGISPDLAVQHEDNTGGAQYIIKNSPDWFWSKIEIDSVKLYRYLNDLLYKKTEHNFYTKKKFNIWLTEMWVVCWNAILAGKPFTLHDSLSFCWANETLTHWENTYMLHYTGIDNSHDENTYTFRKGDYTFFNPFYSSLSHISSKSSSYPLASLIKEYKKELWKKRFDLSDCLFILYSNKFDKEQQNTIIYNNYLSKHLATNIFIVKNNDSKENAFNKLKSRKDIKYWFVLNSDILLPIATIKDTVKKIKQSEKSVILLNCKEKLFEIDILSLFIFSKILEDDFLHENLSKMARIPIKNNHVNPIIINISDMPFYPNKNTLDKIIMEASMYQKDTITSICYKI